MVEGALGCVIRDSASRLRSGWCCGLAGDGNLLIDAYQSTGHHRYLDAARSCARRLAAFADPSRPGVYRLAAGTPTASPDLFQGYAGVGAFHLRLAAPASAPDLVLGDLASP